MHLYLANDDEVQQSFHDILALARLQEPKAQVDGVTVSPMAKPGGLEVILGAVTDPQYGPTLMFGLGGIYTELYQDVAFCLLPADDEELDALIRSIRGYPLLTGFRGQPHRDLEALKTAMKALARFAQNTRSWTRSNSTPCSSTRRASSPWTCGFSRGFRNNRGRGSSGV